MVCKTRPTTVGQPFTATGPKRPLNKEFVNLYVKGFTIKTKMTAENKVICHFCELDAIIYYSYT